jgi:flagellar biosynthetic protein FliR
MISITSGQIDTWIASFIFPLARILGFISTAPLWSSAGIPRRTRLMLGVGITVAITQTLPAMPNTQPASLDGLAILAQQVIIGIAMGFAAKVVFAAVELAGEFISLQMGLGFATAYDPLSSSQTAVVSEFLNLLTLSLFLSMNGHLVYFATLSQSFSAFPVSATPIGSASWLNLAELGAKIFAFGVLLALPVVVALMITNVALAVLTRAAPQLNIFALGFPLTLLGGFIGMAVIMNYLTAPLQSMFDLAINSVLNFATPVSQ